VTVAVERGTAVHPAPPDDARAAGMAGALGAVLAASREQVSDEHPWSLSPAALRAAPAVARLVLPSPNGSAIAAAADGVVVAACLRNARAVAAWIGGPVTVVAAGERRRDGSLRPALEDLLGAGAVISALAGRGFTESPRAAAARAAYERARSVPDAVRGCTSGRELAARGFAADVEVAVEIDASEVVPLLAGGAFAPA
jgi:2-phosphosulfolactate phosphatase